MTNTKHQPAQLKTWNRNMPILESLPGQRLLFYEEVPLKMDPTEIEISARQRRELFYTGKDLPGAKEREQVILWDVP